MKEISNKTLMYLLVAAIVVSILSTLIGVNIIRVSTVGKAAGTVDIEILQRYSIALTDSAINFGSCTPTATGCTIDSISNSEPACCALGGGTWPDNITIENDGNVNLNLTIETDTDASGLIGGSSPEFRFYGQNAEATTCAGTLQSSALELSATGTKYVICDDFGFANSADLIYLFVELFLPEDASVAATQAGLTIEGVARAS